MRIKSLFLAFLLICTGMSVTTRAAESQTTETRVVAIQERLTTIKNMDFSRLDKTQKGELRHELKDLKSELKLAGPQYIYISAGALILIIILIILLL